eukprot:TRINITY_DN226_c0_g1_i3.p1 TRINITY_DN226_c0_g1~~TRINITY_DN226_c0_g1_i3.p1  ORF type:complete len:983 (-),score=234.89 TRINITY_DN226_c0_g1_i3:242-3190(-)
MVSIYEGSTVLKKTEQDAMRMSLSSSITGGLDVADLSSVWNRNQNAADIDASIAEEVTQKYKQNKLLEFQDSELEEDFFEKYFFNSIKTHRAFCLIVPGLYFLFMINAVATKSYVSLFVYLILAGGTLGVYFYLRTKNYRRFQYQLCAGLVMYHAYGLAIQRQLISNEIEEKRLMLNDGRNLAVFYVFVLYSGMMSLRLTLRTIIKIWVAVIIGYYIMISFLELTTPEQYLDCTFFLGVISISLGVAAYSTESANRNQEVRRAGILRHTEEVTKEKMITEKLLLNILPVKIARRLMDHEDVIADHYDNVTVLFADLVGWTEIARSLGPTESIGLLNEIVSNFDRMTLAYKIEKIKTIGDGYLVACGLPEAMDADQSCRIMADFALDVLVVLDALSRSKGVKLDVTMGLHTGTVVAGVIGKTKFLYDLWGDSVNTASRMQSHGDAGKIHVTERVHQLLGDEYEFEKRPVMEIKGKGEMQTYFLTSRKAGRRTMTTRDDGKEGTKTDGEEKKLEEAKSGEDDPMKKMSRKERKSKEALRKKNAELDEQLEAQIKQKWGLLYFVDSNLEGPFSKLQDQILEDRMPYFTGFLIFIELISGLDMFAFHSEYIAFYYKVFGTIASVQLATMIVGHYARRSAPGLNTFNLVINRLGFVVLYAFLRREASLSTRFVFFLNAMTTVVMYKASQAPYRVVRRIEFSLFIAFLLILRGINPEIGLDLTGIMTYFGQLIYGHETAKHVEKQARREFLLSNAADEERKKVVKQREESERLLHNILPEALINRMRDGSVKLIDQYDMASVLFADIVGFTVLSSKLDAPSIVKMLNNLFSQVDTVAEMKGLEKIKTIGDAYMVVAGLPYPRPDHAKIAVEMALEMVRIVQSLPEIEGLRVNVRIGVHSGPVVGGIIGASKMVFDIWGKNVNIASKMESNGTPGCVNVSHVTRDLIGDGEGIVFEKREKVVKYGDQTIELYYAKSQDSVAISTVVQDW